MKLPSNLSRFLLCLLIAGGCLGEVSAFQGGDPAKFTSLRDEIRKIEREISKKFTAMPVGFPKEQEAQMKEIEVMRTRITELRKQLDESAIESFTADPDRNQPAKAHIVQMAVAKLEGRGEGRPFDPARTYELAMLLAKGKDGPDYQTLAIAFQACMAMQDFQRSEIILKKLKNLNVPISEKDMAQIENLKKSWEKELARREKDQQQDNLPRVQIETEFGNMVIELFEDDSPQTVANFIHLVEQGFYDGTYFQDIRPGDTARAGCPKGDGTGDPGYRIANEPTDADSRRFFAGTVGMHHDGVDTAGCMFFITYQPKPLFDLKYVAFGRIIEGLETLYSLPRSDPKTAQLSSAEPPKIIRATVLRKRDHEYVPTKVTTLMNTDLLNQSPAEKKEPNSIPDVAPKDDN